MAATTARPPDACFLHRQDHTVADRTALVASEELDISNQPEPDRYDALLCYPSPSLVEQVPKPLPCKAELNLSGRAQNPVSGLGDIDGIELAIAEFAKTGNRKYARVRAFGLQPFPAFAATI